jgi:hypothetical protein
MMTRQSKEEDGNKQIRNRRKEANLGVELGVGIAVLRVGSVVAVGPEPVDAEVRRRLAGLGVAAALLRVAVRPRPLQDEVE